MNNWTSCAILGIVMSGAAHAQLVEPLVWRFELDGPFAGADVGVGPDGTVYASDSTTLYAINADGSFKWTRDGLGDGTPISFLDDGAIVVGTGQTVWALENDGSTRWSFSFDGNNGLESIEVGPSVGPDGNIYCVTSVKDGFGLGAFSLTPDGDFRWSNEGTPTLDNLNGTNFGPVYFTSEQMIFPFNNVQDSPPHVHGFDLDGDQSLYVDFTCTSVPRVAPFDRLVLSGACGVQAIDPQTEEIFWTVDFGEGTLLPAIDETGMIYSGEFLHDLTALNPDGSIAWTSDTAAEVVRVLGAHAGTERVVYRTAGFGDPVPVGIVDSTDGTLLGTLLLEQVGEDNELVESAQVAFSADGTIAYFSTRFTGAAAPSAVYAMRVVESGCAADFNGDGVLNVLDFVAFQNAFVQQDPKADCDVNGAFNILDFVCFQNLFGAGCP
jgi:hypothetical protein